jgi:hypothetical protein
LDSADLFNKNADSYVCTDIYDYDLLFLNYIISHKFEKTLNVADIGGGSGQFLMALRERERERSNASSNCD